MDDGGDGRADDDGLADEREDSSLEAIAVAAGGGDRFSGRSPREDAGSEMDILRTNGGGGGGTRCCRDGIGNDCVMSTGGEYSTGEWSVGDCSAGEWSAEETGSRERSMSDPSRERRGVSENSLARDEVSETVWFGTGVAFLVVSVMTDGGDATSEHSSASNETS